MQTSEYKLTVQHLETVLKNRGWETALRVAGTVVQSEMEKEWRKYQKAKPIDVPNPTARLLGTFRKRDSYDYRVPGQDHAQLYKLDGRYLCLVFHPYHLYTDTLRDLVAFCDEHELDCRITAKSSYFPSGTLCVEIMKKRDKKAWSEERWSARAEQPGD